MKRGRKFFALRKGLSKPSTEAKAHQIVSFLSSKQFVASVLAAALICAAISIQYVSRTDPIPGETSDSTLQQTHAALEAMALDPLFDPETITDPWKVQLFQRLDRVRVACGMLCQLNTREELEKHTEPVPDSAIAMARVEPVDCPAIIGSKDIDASDTTTPAIPPELLPYFTLNKSVAVTDHEIRKDIYLGGTVTRVWTEQAVNDVVARVKAGTEIGTYGDSSTAFIRDDVGRLPIRGKSLLVIGTEKPWLEAILLLHGAAEVTTLEYAPIKSEHPKIKTLQPHEFRERFLVGTLPTYDGILTHSSLEHSGLGRYGDTLNPWGDILAVARAWCVTKKGGFMYLGLPTGKDVIQSNWHRVYGVIRWPLVASNWKPMPSTSDGSELNRGMDASWRNGGFGYNFIKE